jgi:hypothetical protein
MKKRMVLKYVAGLFLIAIAPFLFTNNVKAEVWLIRGEKKFLGWKLEDNKFKTCSGNIIKIEKDDKIEKTDDTCREAGILKRKLPKAKK